MKFVDEFRDGADARAYAAALARITTGPWRIMEVCGGQTHSIVRFGIDRLLPTGITLIHGPGCPVCVTSLEMIDRALAIARIPKLIFCTFGDMLRVPGSHGDLFEEKSRGADVRIVYSPLDALSMAEKSPERQVVFFAVGFETTAPAIATVVREAARRKVRNFSVLVSHVLVPPALRAILASEQRRVDGFLAAGHVCTVMGVVEYEPIASKYGVPIVVTGFEPLDLLQGIYLCVRQLESRRAAVEIQYTRAVRPEGNVPARELIRDVFQIVPRKWRGIGPIPESGLALRDRYREFDAEHRMGIGEITAEEPKDCMSGLVLQGLKRPNECPAFGTRCTPDHPLGATMVSAEGACAAYYRYRGAAS